MSIVWYFVALVVLIALSAFFSASEMSYSSANRLRLENAAEDGSRRARAAVGILDHYDRALSAILIGNNLVNIASSSLGSVIVILLAGEQWTWVSTVVLTLLVIIFGETMPKIVAKQNANGIALRNAYVIRALSIVLYPVIWLVVGLVHLITRPLRGDTGDGDPEEAASQELQSIIETAEDEDVLDEDRSELLRSALDFSDISASEAMTARVDMVALGNERMEALALKLNSVDSDMQHHLSRAVVGHDAQRVLSRKQRRDGAGNRGAHRSLLGNHGNAIAHCTAAKSGIIGIF